MLKTNICDIFLYEKFGFKKEGIFREFVLRDNKNAIKIFVHANDEECILREMKRLGMERKEAEEWINKTNIYR